MKNLLTVIFLIFEETRERQKAKFIGNISRHEEFLVENDDGIDNDLDDEDEGEDDDDDN